MRLPPDRRVSRTDGHERHLASARRIAAAVAGRPRPLLVARRLLAGGATTARTRCIPHAAPRPPRRSTTSSLPILTLVPSGHRHPGHHRSRRSIAAIKFRHRPGQAGQPEAGPRQQPRSRSAGRSSPALILAPVVRRADDLDDLGPRRAPGGPPRAATSPSSASVVVVAVPVPGKQTLVPQSKTVVIRRPSCTRSPSTAPRATVTTSTELHRLVTQVLLRLHAHERASTQLLGPGALRPRSDVVPDRVKHHHRRSRPTNPAPYPTNSACGVLRLVARQHADAGDRRDRWRLGRRGSTSQSAGGPPTTLYGTDGPDGTPVVPTSRHTLIQKIPAARTATSSTAPLSTSSYGPANLTHLCRPHDVYAERLP